MPEKGTEKNLPVPKKRGLNLVGKRPFGYNQSTVRQLKLLAISALSLLALYNSYRTFGEVKKRSLRLEEGRKKVEALREEKAALEAELEYKQSPEFVEKEARDKLGLVLSGEKIVIIPPNLAESVRQRVRGVTTSFGDNKLPFQQWNELFF